MSEFICRAFPIFNCDSSGSSGSLQIGPPTEYDAPVNAVPEPGAGLLFASALVISYVWARR